MEEKELPFEANKDETLKDLAKAHAELVAAFKRIEEEYKERTGHVDAQMVAMHTNILASSAKVDAQLTAMSAKVAEVNASVSAKIAEVNASVGGISASNGMVAEEMLYNSLSDRMTFGGVKFDEISIRLKMSKTLPNGTKIQGEFDLALFNGTSITLIDVKYRARKEDVDYLIDKQLPKFRLLFPKYNDCKVYLGLGGMSFEKDVETAALQRGVGVLKVKGETVEVNDGNVKAWV